MKHHNALALAAVMAATVMACDEDVDPGAPTDEVTYYQHIKPIIDARCAQCHADRGIAPFSLTTYEHASTYAAVSALAIEEGTMPPWKPSDDCNDYIANRSLTEEQKALIKVWAQSGAPEGDPASPAPPLEVETRTLSRVDLTLAMPEPYTPQASLDQTDDYRCFIIPWPEQTTTYVTGFRGVPGDLRIAHHMIAYVASAEQAAEYQALDDAEPEPGYTCFGGPGGTIALDRMPRWLGAWAPGGMGYDLPDGLGLEVSPGSFIILQMHYNTLNAGPGDVPPDTTSLELKLDPQVDRVARMQPWASPAWIFDQGMHIPANQADVVHSFEYDATYAPGLTSDEFDIYTGSLHMHLLGRSGRASIERADGSSECILQIDDWDFDWQDSYPLRTPMTFRRGDKLRVECRWDNSQANQPVIRGEVLPPRDVYWGEGSTDEMCLSVFLIAER